MDLTLKKQQRNKKYHHHLPWLTSTTQRLLLFAILQILATYCHNINVFAFQYYHHHSTTTHCTNNNNNNRFINIQRQHHRKSNNNKVLSFLNEWRQQQSHVLLRMNGGSGNANEKGDAKSKNVSSNNNIQSTIQKFVNKNFFLIGMFIAVILARLFPSVGMDGGILHPELFIGKYGVTIIFLLSGLSLEIQQLQQAIINVKLNTCIQIITFLFWPLCIGIPLTKYILRNILPQPLLDGILILTCLPTTVNMCVILTSSAGGNVAAALCNAVFSNLAGIFITPFLLFRFFAGDNNTSAIQLPFFQMLIKLSNKVLLPVLIGQTLRFINPIKEFYEKHSKFWKRLQEVILLSILWNAFCTAITSSSLGLELRYGITLLTLLPTLQFIMLGSIYIIFSSALLNFPKKDVVAAMFCGSHKTLAFGLPLIHTIFQGNTNIAAYCAPLMFIHPIQLIIGSALLPKLEQYIDNNNDSSAEDEE